MASHEVTELLGAWDRGDRPARDRLMRLVQSELRRLARGYLRAERPGHTLQTTALVNEAYIRLVGQNRISWQNRGHFFGIAAQMMRRVLVDHSRRKKSAKRGASATIVSLSQANDAAPESEVDVLALDEALDDLAKLDPRQAKVVELRFFGGLGVEETAASIGVSTATVKREWVTAKAWLFRRLKHI